MKIKALLFLATVVAVSFNSCKDDEDPTPPPTNNNGGGNGGGGEEPEDPPAGFMASTDSSDRNVYLEIYTGVRDKDWPSAEQQLNVIHGALEDSEGAGRVIIATIHQGVYANKDPRYTTDAVYTTPYGDALAKMAYNTQDLNQIGPYSYGSINRIKPGQGIVFNPARPGGTAMDISQWNTKGRDALRLYSSVNIGADADITGNMLTVDVDLYYTGNEPDSTYINVALLQDNLLSDQWTSNGAPLDDYAHNHVLRDLITGLKGDKVDMKTPPKTWVRESYSYELPNHYNGSGVNGGGAVVNSDLKVVVFVTEKNGQVITAEEILL